MRKVILLSFTLLLVAFSTKVGAQEVKFELDAPRTVRVGEQFMLSFDVSAEPQKFTPPTFEGLNLIAGPTESRGQSTHIDLNTGKSVSAVSYRFAYVLQPTKEGVINIGAAKVVVNGKTYSTQSAPIEVVKSDVLRDNKSSAIAPDDMMFQVTANRTNVYKGEPIRVTMKVLTRMPLRIGGEKMAAFNGFWVQELTDDGSRRQRVTLNGKVYESITVKEVLVIPQQSGELFIEESSIMLIVQTMVKSETVTGDPFFDGLLGGGQELREITKWLSSKPIRVTVKDLPAGAPASFTGAVGRYEIVGGLNNSTLNANESGSYMLQIVGEGNMPLISSPRVDLPSSFEKYNVKSVENFHARGNTISGKKQFEYPFIARSEGVYTVDKVEFAYFDPQSETYKTLRTQEQSIDIHADTTTVSERMMVSGLSKEEVKVLGQDIHYIRTEDPELSRIGRRFFMSPLYCVLFLSLIGLSIFGYFRIRKMQIERSNVVLLKNKKANKVALQRLKQASHYLEANNEGKFYEELLRALWGYMSDKLNIPIANLTKDTIREQLIERKVSNERVNQFVDIISTCEYAQYSPHSPGMMGELYNGAVSMLSKFESIINK